MLGQGLMKVDDYIKFGGLVDKLSKYCYTINYIPSSDVIVVSFKRGDEDNIKKIAPNAQLIVPNRGGLAFAKIRWRAP